MTETLGDLLRRSADAATGPHVDVDDLVARADRHQRRRRLAAIATTTALVAVIVAGSFVIGTDQSGEPQPAPSLPSPTVVNPEQPADHTRPLVYAEDSTVHVGDRTFDAGATVWTLDVTDDGAVYVTEDSDTDPSSEPVWFSDGSTPVAIGTIPTEHYSRFAVSTAAAGSLVVWPDATSDRFVVYDTSRREVVAQIRSDGVVLHVDDSHVYFNPDPGTPGCWVVDIQDLRPCADPHLYRYDVASGKTTRITRSTMDADLLAQGRIFTAHTADGAAVLTESPQFAQVGRRLVASVHHDVQGAEATGVSRTNGDEVRLRLPGGYHLPGDVPDVNQVSYWLDDDRVVISAGDSGGDVPPTRGDLLVCRLPDAVCQVAQRDVSLVTAR